MESNKQCFSPLLSRFISVVLQPDCFGSTQLCSGKGLLGIRSELGDPIDMWRCGALFFLSLLGEIYFSSHLESLTSWDQRW